MTSLFSEEAFSALTSEVAEKVVENDDAASTASGAPSLQSSLASSPVMSEGALASSMASPTKSPSSPWTSTVAPESLKDLPSLGSLGHFAGLCSRCCFHSKGRCQNGYDCRFCHFDHEKRPRKKKPTVGAHVRGLPTTPVHVQLEHRGFHNEAWAMTATSTTQYLSAPLTPQYASGSPTYQNVSAYPGLELQHVPCPPPPPLNNPVVPTTDSKQAGCVEGWPVEKVVTWLNSTGLGHLAKSFEEHRITGDVLLELVPSDLEEIGVRALGDKKRLLRAVAQLQTPDVQASCPPPPPTPAPSWQAPSLESPSLWGSCMTPQLTPPPSFDAPLM